MAPMVFLRRLWNDVTKAPDLARRPLVTYERSVDNSGKEPGLAYVPPNFGGKGGLNGTLFGSGFAGLGLRR